MTTASSTSPAGPGPVVVEDRFGDDRRRGTVVGSRASNGTRRGGVDVERVMSIDDGALRIQPLVEPGWGRAVLSYGPYPRRSGLAFAVFMMNGHNTAQSEQLTETFRQRVQRWGIGSETYRLRRRLVQWIRSGRMHRVVRQFAWWMHIHKGASPVPAIDENLAVGWFPQDVPRDPLAGGNAFVMHATDEENGELWLRTSGHPAPTIRGVQNLQTYYVVMLRSRGAAYYASSIAGAPGFGSYPSLRPLGIDIEDDSTPVYAGLCQSVLGQIGFRLDTRVYGCRVASVSDAAAWYGTAHAADSLVGSGPLGDAECGGRWDTVSGAVARGPHGAHASGVDGAAVLRPPGVSGLIHAVVRAAGEDSNDVALLWRYEDADNHWGVRLGGAGGALFVLERGRHVELARFPAPLRAATDHAVQILDGGPGVRVFLDGRPLLARDVVDDRLRTARGVGLRLPAGTGTTVRAFEAHPAEIVLPKALDMGEPWVRRGGTVVAGDDFQRPAGDLAGTSTTTGGKVWRRELGAGVIDLTGQGAAKIRATARMPNPGRTIYTIDWEHPEFADVEVDITPPGTARGQGEHGLSGVVMWQDPDNYIAINIWLCDQFDGASISTFFQLDGFEDVYDAIWTNVGDQVFFGIPLTFRMTFDGTRYLAFVNGQPVLYRALTDVYPKRAPLAIRRVGLLANWEWGNDTGSVFRAFAARV